LVNGADVLHVYLNGDHYSGPMITVRNGEYYKKFFGPFGLYCTGKGNASQCWQDAKDRQKKDAAEWPFTWMSHNTEYPQKAQRGRVSGIFSIKDAAKPTIGTADSWIGLTQFDTTNKSEDFQHEAKHYQYWAKVGANGVFTIPNIRPGTYKLFAYQTGEVGQYEQENIVVSANKDTKLGTVTWTIPRNKGDLVWEIGIADRRTNEYKLGSDHYFDGFIYNDFYKYFANPLEYTVENKNWADAFCYAHSSYKQDTNAAVPWTWNLNFTLKNKPTTGVATLTIAFAGNDRGSMVVTVNGRQIQKFYPPNGGGNALLRQSNFAKYGVTEIQIPVANLKIGKNTVNLYNSMTGHVMYDYLSFEMANSVVTSLDAFDSEDMEVEMAYPNPFQDKVTLKSEGDFAYTITSISGASILKGTANTQVEIGENLEPGIYLVKMSSVSGEKTIKIVKK
jgi:hypothetical protein